MPISQILFKALRLAAYAAAAVSLATAATAQTSEELRAQPAAYQRDDLDNGYRLGTGDQIRVTVYGEDDLSGQFTVDGNGYVSLPLIGQIKAGGASASDLESQITAKLADGYLNDPRVSIEITTYRPFYVLGQVNKPGEYAYVNGMTILNAVALAGGYTDQADDTNVYVRRNGTTKEVEVPADQTTHINPGDVVRVSRTTFWSVVSVVTPIIMPAAQIATPAAYLAHP